MTGPTAPIGSPGGGPVGPDEGHARLRQVARQLEAVFVQQLFHAMRATVPSGGVADPSSPDGMFFDLMDQQLAEEAANQMPRGIGEAIYRYLLRAAEDGAELGGSSLEQGETVP